MTEPDFPPWTAARRSIAAVIPLRFPRAVPARDPPAPAIEEPDRPFGSAGRDGRVPWPLPAGTWRVGAEVALRPAEAISWITPLGTDRVLASGPSAWVLVLPDGGIAAMGQAGGSEQVADSSRGRFYLPARSGALEARSLRDGSLRFFLTPAFGDGFRRILIAPDRDRLIVLGVERSRGGHSGHVGHRSVIETIALPDPLTPGAGGALEGAVVRERLMFPTVRIAAAALGPGLFLAMPNEIVELDRDLRACRVFQGAFVPLSLSIGAGPRLHLVAEVDGRRYYWAVTSKGERVISIALPVGAGKLLAPPVLAEDGGAALVLADRILSIGGGGRIAWELAIGRELEGPPVGATRSADGQLLVSAGRAVLAVSPEGTVRVLTALQEPLTAPPILDSLGRLWVAGKTRLLRLDRER